LYSSGAYKIVFARATLRSPTIPKKPNTRIILNNVDPKKNKIENNPKRPKLIKTVRGTGYVLAMIVDSDQ